jgi:hypothetical protein
VALSCCVFPIERGREREGRGLVGEKKKCSEKWDEEDLLEERKKCYEKPPFLGWPQRYAI